MLDTGDYTYMQVGRGQKDAGDIGDYTQAGGRERVGVLCVKGSYTCRTAA